MRTNVDIWDEEGKTLLKLIPLSNGKVGLSIEDVNADPEDLRGFRTIDVNLEELRTALEKIGWDN